MLSKKARVVLKGRAVTARDLAGGHVKKLYGLPFALFRSRALRGPEEGLGEVLG